MATRCIPTTSSTAAGSCRSAASCRTPAAACASRCTPPPAARCSTARRPSSSFLSRLGPDALSAKLDWRTLAARLDAPTFRRRSLAALYLDQGFLAGIGNYLRSEILFFAGVPPDARPMDLDDRTRATLARVSLTVTRRAYEARGVNNPHQRVQALKAAGAKRGGYRFAVFAREGQACHDCGTTIVRTEANSRRLYWCPSCQRAR
jgi:endonuclease VIII